jgi:hypothetical protein
MSIGRARRHTQRQHRDNTEPWGAAGGLLRSQEQSGMVGAILAISSRSCISLLEADVPDGLAADCYPRQCVQQSLLHQLFMLTTASGGTTATSHRNWRHAVVTAGMLAVLMRPWRQSSQHLVSCLSRESKLYGGNQRPYCSPR